MRARIVKKYITRIYSNTIRAMASKTQMVGFEILKSDAVAG